MTSRTQNCWNHNFLALIKFIKGRQEVIVKEKTEIDKCKNAVENDVKTETVSKESVIDPTELKLWQLFETAAVKVTQKQNVHSPVHQKTSNSETTSPSHRLYLNENLSSTDMSSDSHLCNEHQETSNIQPDLLEVHRTTDTQDKHMFASGDPASLFPDSNAVNVQV